MDIRDQRGPDAGVPDFIKLETTASTDFEARLYDKVEKLTR